MIQAVETPAVNPPAHDPFERIIGQRRVIPFLKEIRDGIWFGAQGHPLLFLGRSGQGKSSLAKAFADSIAADFLRIDCGPELRSENLVERLTALQSLTVVLCDEFQSMRRPVQEILYSAVDSHMLPKLERGRLDRCAAQVKIVPFVLIGATNEPGRLLPALRSRMVSVVMDDYSLDDLRAIVRQKASRYLMHLSDTAVDLVVRASGGSPRTIVQVLQSVDVTSSSWRFTIDNEPPPDASSDSIGCDLGNEIQSRGHAADAKFPTVPDELVERALVWMGIDRAGLDATGRTLLSTIRRHGRATAELLATVLGLDMAFTRENLAELRARQFVTASPGRGWVLTEAGENVAAESGAP
jgi:Holliday junction resolvasome RuvABC ATP-dependent DNA helicase subunit